MFESSSNNNNSGGLVAHRGTRDPNYNPKIAIEVRRLTSRFNLQLFRSFWMAYIESIGNVQ